MQLNVHSKRSVHITIEESNGTDNHTCDLLGFFDVL